MTTDITVLYIEDDKEIAEEIIFFLNQKVKRVLVAYDGEEGLEKFHTAQPDIIVTDIQMPRLNGLDMIEKIREKNHDIPIIIVSAFNETDKLLRAIELKVDGYLTKPINIKDLLCRIQKLTKPKVLQQAVDELRYQNLKKSELKYQRLLELSAQTSKIAFWELDIPTKTFIFNDLSYAFLHTSIEKEKSYTMDFESYLDTYILKDEREYIRNILAEAMKKSNDYIETFEHKIKRCDGVILNVSTTAYFVYNEDGQLERSYGTAFNIGDIKAEQNKMKRYIDLIDHYIATSSTDLEGKIVEVSQAFCQLTGYTKEELLGNTHNILRDQTTSKNFYQDLWNTITQNKIFNGEIKNIKKDGTPFWVQLRILPLYDDTNNEKIGYLEIEQDITDKKRIEELSVRDMLTGLYNRRYLSKKLQQEINRTKREGYPFAFVMIDIDFFKRYNDSYGHPKGDEALKKLSDVLKKFTHRGGDYSFRMGGEEFALILQYDSLEHLQKHLNNLKDAVEMLKIIHKENTVSDFLTISIGVVCVHPDTSFSDEDIYKIADNALYKAKESGRNKIEYAKGC